MGASSKITKWCSKCKQRKFLDEFHKCKQKKDGYRYYCKSCINKYYQKNKKRLLIRSRKHYHTHKKQNVNYRLKRKFDITLKQYDKMFEDQNGICAICGKPESNTFKGVIKRLAVDHDHKTGKVRSLLCQNCNAALGMVFENIKTLKNMIVYLKKKK